MAADPRAAEISDDPAAAPETPAEVKISGASQAAARGPTSRMRSRKAKWDDQPRQPAEVLIATVGVAIPAAVIREARELGGDRPVAVLSIARIHGSSFGLPNPGLLPSKREMTEQQALVSKAINSLERSGVEAAGQVAATRRYSKTIARAARAQGVSHVLVVCPSVPRWRTILEGDTAREVRRRLRKDAVVRGIVV